MKLITTSNHRSLAAFLNHFRTTVAVSTNRIPDQAPPPLPLGRGGWLRRRLFGLPPAAVDFEKRGFRSASAENRQRINAVCNAFVAGYHASLEVETIAALTPKLAGMDNELRGFAYEGAAMGLALRDRMMPWRAELVPQFLQGQGNDHAYMIHVGIGWVWARLPWGFRRAQKKLHPLLGWLAVDGWGFHEGFFHWPKYINGAPAPKKLSGYERRAFDQGFGRSLWFVLGGNPGAIAATITKFSTNRRADLWSGIGLAATCAGMVDEACLKQIQRHAGEFSPALAQGAAFAAKARQRAGNVTEYTEFATKHLCGQSVAEAAHVTDRALENLPTDAAEPAYEIWRQRIQHHFQPQNLLLPA